MSATPALAPETRAWLVGLGFAADHGEETWLEALTHGSTGAERNYERLEFLGDRVLGLSIAEWLFATSGGAEGKLSQRLNALVSRATCADVAREIGLPAHMVLGKQARDDGGAESENILCDGIEALLGANFSLAGFAPTRDLVRQLWADAFAGRVGHAKHPKSALQEWAAGNNRRPPEYRVVDRSGPDHALRFTVSVAVKGVGEVEASGTSKAEAERLAAARFMEEFG